MAEDLPVDDWDEHVAVAAAIAGRGRGRGSGRGGRGTTGRGRARGTAGAGARGRGRGAARGTGAASRGRGRGVARGAGGAVPGRGRGAAGGGARARGRGRGRGRPVASISVAPQTPPSPGRFLTTGRRSVNDDDQDDGEPALGISTAEVHRDSDVEEEEEEGVVYATAAASPAAASPASLAAASAAHDNDDDEQEPGFGPPLPAARLPGGGGGGGGPPGGGGGYEDDDEDNEEDARNAALNALLARLDDMHSMWSPTPDQYQNSLDGMIYYFREKYAPGADPTVPLESGEFNEHYSAFVRDALTLKKELRNAKLLRVSESSVADDATLQRNQDCVEKIERILESIWTSNNWLRLTERQLHIMDDTSQQMFSQARLSDFRYSPFSEDDMDQQQQFCFWILQQCRFRGYRKKGDWLYKQYITADGFHTHAWVRDIKIHDFIWRCVHPADLNWPYYLSLTSSRGLARSVAEQLECMHSYDLPFLEETRGYWSFPNGVFYIGDLKKHNRDKMRAKRGGANSFGMPAPSMPQRNSRWGYEEGDGPKFFKFLKPGEKLPDPCPTDLGDARYLPGDVVAVNYIPVPFEFERYTTEMAEYKKTWTLEHATEIADWAAAHQGELHPRLALEGFHMGIMTQEIHTIFKHQFEIREHEKEAIRSNTRSDLQGKGFMIKEQLDAAAEQAVREKQEEIEHVYEVHYLCLGRLLFPVDGWRFQPFFLGTSGTGKSTALRAIQEMFQAGQVTLMANRVEKGFSIQDMVINESLLWLAMDVDDKFQLDQMQWHSMVGGEGVNAAVKNKTAISIPAFDISGAMAGNSMPPFNDNGGAASIRMATFEYPRPVKTSNTGLLSSIKQNHPALMYKCVKARHYFIRRYAGVGPYDERSGWLGKYFKRTKGNVTVDANPLEAFLAKSGQVTVGEGFYCSQEEFITTFIQFCEKQKKSHRWSPLHHMNVLLKYDIVSVTGISVEKYGTGLYFTQNDEILMGVALSKQLSAVPVLAATNHSGSHRRSSNAGGNANGSKRRRSTNGGEWREEVDGDDDGGDDGDRVGTPHKRRRDTPSSAFSGGGGGRMQTAVRTPRRLVIPAST